MTFHQSPKSLLAAIGIGASLLLAGCMSSETTIPGAGTISRKAPKSAEVSFDKALSTAVSQCVQVNEVEMFSAAALERAGFVSNSGGAGQFQVRLGGAEAGQSFSVVFPEGGANGCRLLTRHADLAPRISAGASAGLKRSGYAVLGGAQRWTATKNGRVLSVSADKIGKRTLRKVPFYQLAIEPKQ